MTSQSFSVQLREVKRAREDFEFYPTTGEIIEDLKKCIVKISEKCRDRYFSRNQIGTVLDIGAGNGKVLDALRDLEIFDKFYAIEKSQVNISNLNKDIFILGVDFWKATLIDKEVDVIFSNPPYSEYEVWVEKILREFCTKAVVYLVIPQRWKTSERIKSVVASRCIKYDIKGEYSFEDAEDRKARAKVDLVEFCIEEKDTYKNDPFVLFFEENFKYPEAQHRKEDLNNRVKTDSLVHGQNLVETLCELYNERMKELHENYQAICSLSPEILAEFEISRDGLIESLKMKFQSTKKEYWRRLFDGMDSIKKRLTKKSRDKIIRLMNDNTGVEFDRDNAYAVVLWVIKNASSYLNDQLIDVYEKMIDYANIEGYVSNQNVFDKNKFRYTSYRYQESDRPTHFKLKVGHRIVLEACGGLYRCPYGISSRNGLSESAADFICDLLTIADNLGFKSKQNGPFPYAWDDNGAREYYFENKGNEELLFRVRAFYNGNMHFQFNPDFIHALNVQHGKLKGWINSPEEAASEVVGDRELAERFFEHEFDFSGERLMLLTDTHNNKQ